MATLFGHIGAETPKFEVIKTLNGLAKSEVRRYTPQVRAEVTYTVNPSSSIMDGLQSPFRSLAGFIFGGNTSRAQGAEGEGASGGSEKVAMTAPVVMQRKGEAHKIAMTSPVVMTKTGSQGEQPAAASSQERTMAFIMPSKYSSPSDLPLPKDARVRLVEVPAATFAAVRFNGAMGPGLAARKEQELREVAAKEGLKLSEDPTAVQYCAYNPPWCLPWFRTNDILIPVLDK